MSWTMQNWVGYYISLECDSIRGKIEGYVSSVNTEKQTISLTSVQQNGNTQRLPSLTISAKNIRDLKIIQIPDKTHGSADQAVLLSDLVCHGGRVVPNDGGIEDAPSNRNRSDSRKGNTPRKNQDRRHRTERDDVCFATPVDSYILEHEFDFEKNLALFDKEAVFKKIDGKNVSAVTHEPNENQNAKSGKYKCDENVIESKPVTLRQIKVPFQVDKEYVTDTGLIVPCITTELRRKILKLAEKGGIDEARQLDMIGRAASEMILQLLGGSHRFMPKNSHQKPSVVVLCGPDSTRNAQALNCARHLSNHSVCVNVLISDYVPSSAMFETELSLFKMTSGKVLSGMTELKNLSADILLSTWGNFPLGPMQKELSDWITNNKAPVYSIDPDSSGETIPSKWCIVPVLPLSYRTDSSRIYLCDLGIPHDIYSKVGITYHSPFGHKFIIPLHGKE